MASRSKPTSDITVDLQDETITITLNSAFMKKISSFRLNDEYEEDFQGNKTKVYSHMTSHVYRMSCRIILSPNIATDIWQNVFCIQSY